MCEKGKRFFLRNEHTRSRATVKKRYINKPIERKRDEKGEDVSQKNIRKEKEREREREN